MSKVNIFDDLQNQPNEKIEAIKKILPDCFDVDGNLIGEKLQEILANNFKTPETERFTFNWAGKQKAREIAYKTYTEGTLKFDKTKSKNFETTKNLIIEGDNLQVLKLLKNSYKGKVKCIYIDPPYNTGQDFVYNDKFELDIQKYLIETGEIDQETGEQLTDYIQKDDGKKHSKWLSFMYPRLMMAREMLQEDGVIFVSIDDNEVHNLKQLMNEIFGEGEFVGCFIWKCKSGGGNDSKFVAEDHEYVVAFSKDKDFCKIYNDPFAEVSTSYNLEDENGKYALDRLDKQSLGYLKSLDFPIIAPDGMEYTVEHKNPESKIARWRWSKETVNERYNELVFKYGKVYTKNYKKDEYMARTLLVEERFGRTRTGKTDFTDLFPVAYFDNPKPVSLIKHLLQISTKPNDLILDFFAGSGTTGQAVMELNQEEFNKQAKDGLLADVKPVGGRRFILVQLPEKIDAKKEAFKAGYQKISDITIERVKRAGAKYQNIDNGFKVLGLVDNPDKENLFTLKNVDDNLFIITHLALFYGYGLNYKIKKIAEKEIYLMKSEIEKTKDAIIILEKNLLAMQDIMLLVKNYGKEKYKFFSCDSALNIELTYNLLQHFQEKNVVVF